MLPQKIVKLQSPNKRFPVFWGLNWGRFPFKKIWVLVKFLFTSHTDNFCKQWTNDNYTKLHTFPREHILFLSMTLCKLAALEENVADFSEQCSQRVSLVVAAYWNPCGHVMLIVSESNSLGLFIWWNPNQTPPQNMANLQNIVTHLCIIVFRYCLMAVFIQQCFGALTFGIVRISEEFELSQFQLTE